MASLDAYVVTFNCGRELINPSIFGPQILNATSSPPDFLVLCLQEVAPIGYAFLAGSYLTPYYNAFRAAVKLIGGDYVNVIARNVGLTAIMIFAKEDVASEIRWLHTAGVGVGVGEMGNKGAVGVRLAYGSGEDTMHLTFVSAHLAAMEENLERRNQDYRNIAENLVFTSDGSGNRSESTPLLQSTEDEESHSGMYHARSHLFFAGDLNYRTSLTPPTEDDLKKFPQPTPNRKDPKHYSNFLANDQLTQQIKERKTLHGLTEAPIDFPPTYKYHPKDDITLDTEKPWNWASHRWPSWCDRITFSPTSIKPNTYQALPLFGTSDHRPVALSASVPLRLVSGAFEGCDVPFTIDQNWKSKRAAARRREMLYGLFAYLTWTYEGEALLLASTVGAVGGWLVLRSMLV
jgi:Endonuclease/Exonuclease/phosphatase family